MLAYLSLFLDEGDRDAVMAKIDGGEEAHRPPARDDDPLSHYAPCSFYSLGSASRRTTMPCISCAGASYKSITAGSWPGIMKRSSSTRSRMVCQPSTMSPDRKSTRLNSSP